MKKILIAIGAAIALAATSCGHSGKATRASQPDTLAQDLQDTATLCGTWLATTAASQDSTAGFRLDDGGKASSINNRQIAIEAWSASEHPDSITLIATVQVKKLARRDTMKYAYRFIKPDSLLLYSGGKLWAAYARKKKK